MIGNIACLMRKIVRWDDDDAITHNQLRMLDDVIAKKNLSLVP
jgi:hypothetical protein